MGANDTREQLDAALEENIRLEADNARLEAKVASLTKTLAAYSLENENLNERARAGWEAADAAEARLLENITGMTDE